MAEEKIKTEKPVKKDQKTAKIAVIRVRGLVRLNTDVKQTLDMLRLYRKNYCIILENTPTNIGMLRKVKDYVTWGALTEETYKELLDKKAEEYKGRTQDSKGKINYSGKYKEVDGKKIKPYFRLNPPVKGFGRKGIKTPFTVGGALGDRKEKVNDLIKRML